MWRIYNFFLPLATAIGGTDTGNDTVDTATETIGELFTDVIIPVILWGVVILGVIRCIMLGIKLMNADSAEEKQNVKKSFTTWLIGTAVIFLSTGLYAILVSVFKNINLG